jgi:hypothetical protein
VLNIGILFESAYEQWSGLNKSMRRVLFSGIWHHVVIYCQQENRKAAIRILSFLYACLFFDWAYQKLKLEVFAALRTSGLP